MFSSWSKKKNDPEAPKELDPESLAAKWNLPMDHKLEWSPIITTLSQAHKVPRSEPMVNVHATTQMNMFHGLPQNAQQFQIQELLTQNCMAKSTLSGVMGYGLGCFIGLFMYSTRTNAIEAQYSTHDGRALSSTAWRGWRAELKDMGRDCHRSGRNFGIIGSSFVFTECCISYCRGKEDIRTPVLAGFIVGALGGLRVSVGSGLAGGCGFAAFSWAIEQWMDRY